MVEKSERPPDDPLGRTLLIYDSGERSFLPLFLSNSDEARFRRLIKIVTQLSYADTFDVRRNDIFPDAKEYDTFLVATNTANSVDNEILKTFLAGFDFWDATVIPFWMGGSGDGGHETEITVRRAWLLLGGRDSRYYKGIKQRDIDTLTAEWLLCMVRRDTR
jgi:hypothetical protein